MKKRVEYCFSCQEVTNQKENKNKDWYCEKCNSFISSSSSTTVLGNFLNDQIKRQLMEKVVYKK